MVQQQSKDFVEAKIAGTVPLLFFRSVFGNLLATRGLSKHEQPSTAQQEERSAWQRRYRAARKTVHVERSFPQDHQ